MNAHEKERNEMLSKIDEEKIKALQEQPVKIDIRKELASIEFMGVNDARDTETIARHFYDLGRQSKPKVCEGLEEEIVKVCDDFAFPLYGLADDYGRELINKIARHFAQWQKEQMISALKNDGDLPIEFVDKFHEIDRNAFQNGEANMREQMLKEAVEGEVVQDIQGVNRVKSFSKIPEWLHFGQKVKLIIVKED